MDHSFDLALERRDEAARMLAWHLEPVLEDLAALDAARKTLAELGQVVPPEPTELADAWERLVAYVAPATEAGLTEELVDAAARSPLGHAIDDLPDHLREAARRRRKLLLRDARTRRRLHAQL